MRAPSVIIVTSGQAEHTTPEVLDRAIQTVLDLKKNPILVLGPDGDEFLRNSRLAEMCELIFDPNFEGAFFSSVKAGLHATNAPAFVMGLECPPADSKVWSFLEGELMTERAQKIDVLKADVESSEVIAPVLVTGRGVQNLKALAAQTDWNSLEHVAACEIALRIKL